MTVAKKKPQGRASGARRMIQLGKRPIQVWVSAEQWDTLARAAAAELRPVAGFVLYWALQAAENPQLGDDRPGPG